MALPTPPEGYTGWFEPESAANTDYQPIYPYNNITQTESGHSFEMDDTPTRERIRLQHRSGTFIEMHPNGDEVHKVYGDGYEITIKNKNVLVEGTCTVTINGDSNINVKGDKIEMIEGNYELHVLGNYSQTVEKTAILSTIGDLSIGCGGALNGTLTLSTGSHFVVDGDLKVRGEVIADKIYSKTRVDAGTGVSAGPLGFVTATGGISVGVPSSALAIAVPGCILAPDIYLIPGTGYAGFGSVNAAIVNGLTINGGVINGGSINAGFLTAGLTDIGLMQAIRMADTINLPIYNSHIHYVGGKGGGVTTTPIPVMI